MEMNYKEDHMVKYSFVETKQQLKVYFSVILIMFYLC